jgi:hypothetical protein
VRLNQRDRPPQVRPKSRSPSASVVRFPRTLQILQRFMPDKITVDGESKRVNAFRPPLLRLSMERLVRRHVHERWSPCIWSGRAPLEQRNARRRRGHQRRERAVPRGDHLPLRPRGQPLPQPTTVLAGRVPSRTRALSGVWSRLGDGRDRVLIVAGRSRRPLPSIPHLQRRYRLADFTRYSPRFESTALPQGSSLPCPAGRFPSPRYHP